MPTGTVKWFSNAKGHGFITHAGSGKDVFVHHSAISGEDYSYRSLDEGASVEFEAVDGPKGPEARNVVQHNTVRPNAQTSEARGAAARRVR